MWKTRFKKMGKGRGRERVTLNGQILISMGYSVDVITGSCGRITQFHVDGVSLPIFSVLN